MKATLSFLLFCLLSIQAEAFQKRTFSAICSIWGSQQTVYDDAPVELPKQLAFQIDIEELRTHKNVVVDRQVNWTGDNSLSLKIAGLVGPFWPPMVPGQPDPQMVMEFEKLNRRSFKKLMGKLGAINPVKPKKGIKKIHIEVLPLDRDGQDFNKTYSYEATYRHDKINTISYQLLIKCGPKAPSI